jgi:short-subunit dehydrogenase
MPVVDISIQDAKRLFDVNVWASIAMIQAFLPLLLKSSNGMIVNHTSISAIATMPLHGTYTASKAAMAMFTGALRMELDAFNIKVVEMKTGSVKTNLISNLRQYESNKLPDGSIYDPAREEIEKGLRMEILDKEGMPAQQWATEVVRDLTAKSPPECIWRGRYTTHVWISSFLPGWVLGPTVKRVTGFDKVQQMLKRQLQPPK